MCITMEAIAFLATLRYIKATKLQCYVVNTYGNEVTTSEASEKKWDKRMHWTYLTQSISVVDTLAISDFYSSEKK